MASSVWSVSRGLYNGVRRVLETTIKNDRRVPDPIRADRIGVSFGAAFPLICI